MSLAALFWRRHQSQSCFPVKNQTMRNASKLFAVSPFAPMQQNMHAGGQTGGNKK
jgi:hypothetical protein